MRAAENIVGAAHGQGLGARRGALWLRAESSRWMAMGIDVPGRRASHPARLNSYLRWCPEEWLYMHVLPSKLVPFPLQSGSRSGRLCRVHVCLVIGEAA